MSEDSPDVNIWIQRNSGDLSATQSLGGVSDADVRYICDNYYPFVQVINSNAEFNEGQTLKFVTLSNGWVIHDYGDAISISRPHVTKQQNSKQIKSNVIDQAKTAEEIAKLIAEKGWTAAEIIAGTTKLKRLLWIEASRAKIELIAYTPSANDRKIYERLTKYTKEMGLAWERPSVPAKAKAKKLEDTATTAE